MEKDSAEKWDRAASDYQKVFRLGQNEYNAGLFSFWESRGMLRPGCRVLDIGCGVGKYAVLFAERGCDVTLVDISPEMLRHAEENLSAVSTPWRSFCCDFTEVSAEEAVFSDGFDFSISTMSPAVRDAETVRKMSGMTKGFCFLSRFCAWRQPLRDELLRRLGEVPRGMMRDPQADVEELIAAVRGAGYRPCVEYADYIWCDRRTAEEMADYLNRHYLEGSGDPERIVSAARELCTDGVLEDAVYTKVAWIFWDARES